MNNGWTFGIITDGRDPNLLDQSIASILREAKNEDDIIVVGGKQKPKHSSVIWIPFDESIVNGWLTKKKNLIGEFSRHERICIMHDYIGLLPGWREGFDRLPDWLTATNTILNADGKRYRDWCVIYNDAWMNPPIDDTKPPEELDGHLLDYTNNSMGRWQYYSGAYFCTTKSIIMSIPLNESRGIAQGEDVEWCRRLYQKYGQEVFKFNPYSKVQLLKQKQPAPWERYSPL